MIEGVLKHGGHGGHSDIVPFSVTPEEKQKLDGIADKILDVAFSAHRQYGSGLLESAYEAIVKHDLERHHGFRVERQKTLPIVHDGLFIEAGYRIDLLIEDSVIVELKSCEKILPIHEAQLLTYLKFSDKKLGFILNFKNRMFKDGIRRLMR